jgi:hypothetical protein
MLAMSISAHDLERNFRRNVDLMGATRLHRTADGDTWQDRGPVWRLTTIPQSKGELLSRQLVEQRLGVLQDRRAKTFGEPVVDGRE